MPPAKRIEGREPLEQYRGSTLGDTKVLTQEEATQRRIELSRIRQQQLADQQRRQQIQFKAAKEEAAVRGFFGKIKAPSRTPTGKKLKPVGRGLKGLVKFSRKEAGEISDYVYGKSSKKRKTTGRAYSRGGNTVIILSNAAGGVSRAARKRVRRKRRESSDPFGTGGII